MIVHHHHHHIIIIIIIFLKTLGFKAAIPSFYLKDAQCLESRPLPRLKLFFFMFWLIAPFSYKEAIWKRSTNRITFESIKTLNYKAVKFHTYMKYIVTWEKMKIVAKAMTAEVKVLAAYH